MTDTRRWIGNVRRMEPPELWPEIERQDPSVHHTDRRGSAVQPWLVLILALAVVGSILYALQDLGGQSATAVPRPNEIVRYRVDGIPQPLDVDGGAAWTAVSHATKGGTGPVSISRIDSRTGTVTEAHGTLGSDWVFAGNGEVWATCNAGTCGGPAVLQLDPATGDVVRTVPLTARVNQIAIGESVVWATTEAGLVRINPEQLDRVTDLFVPGSFNWVGLAASSVWVTTPHGIDRIDPGTGIEQSVLRMPDPCYFDASGSMVFAATCNGDHLGRGDHLVALDAATGAVRYRTPLDGWGQMRLVGSTLWIAGNDPGDQRFIRLLPFDARTGEPAGPPYEVSRGKQQYSFPMPMPANVFFAVGAGSLWMTDFGAGEVVRVGLPVSGTGMPTLAPTHTSSPSPETTPPETVSVSWTLERTPGIRCTASMPSDMEPGAPLGLAFTLENTSSSPVDVTTSGPSFSLVVTAGDGTTWQLQALMAHSWPYFPPTRLGPGESETAHPGAPLNVQFPGPLTVTPTCAGERMDPLHVTVADVGPSVSDTNAVERARAATSGLLEDCDPPPNGSTTGTIAPPADPATAVSVACAASVSRYPGFSVVTFAIGIPAGADAPRPPSGLLAVVPVPSAPRNAETAVWRFVVTASHVVPVASATSYRSTANGDTMTTEYEVSTEAWKDGGASRCGGSGSAMGGGGSSVTIVLLSACEHSS